MSRPKWKSIKKMPKDEPILVTLDEKGMESNCYIGWIDAGDNLFYGDEFEVGISSSNIKGWYPIPEF